MDAHWEVLKATISPLSVLNKLTQQGGPQENVCHVIEGNCKSLLLSVTTSDLLRKTANPTANDLDQWQAELVKTVAVRLKDKQGLALQLAAIAALQVFVQANLTGPIPNVPECPAHLNKESTSENGLQSKYLSSSAAESTSLEAGNLGAPLASEGDRWAVKKLSSDGEDLQGRVRMPQYLVLALQLLLTPLGLQALGRPKSAGAEQAAEVEAASVGDKLAELSPTWAWWLCRAVALQQRLLSGPSSSLRSLICILIPQVFKEVEQASEVEDRSKKQLLVLANLEAALIEQMYRSPTTAAQNLLQAQEAAGFSAQLTGIMGRRTEHQADAKAQLMVLSSRDGALSEGEADDSSTLEQAGSEKNVLELAANSPSQGDVLEDIRVADGAETSGRAVYSPLEQAILLALAEQQRRQTANDELRPWQVAAYSDAVLQQISTRYMLRRSAKLYRIRFEKTRSRTRERALLAMEQLINSSNSELPSQMSRMCFAYAVPIPTIVELQKEYGEQLVACGLVGAAMEIFERMELWDNLLVCYRLLEKVPQALALVKARLEVDPEDAKLLCALGDLTMDPEHYEEAWRRSHGRSSRAQRSLAKYQMSKSEFSAAAKHWELALGINPLNPEGWFSLGYCYLKIGNSRRSVQSFTRCTQQQPDNGDAWNNIAAINIQDGKYKEAFSAFKEAVKYKRDSWQTWSNYAAAAVKCNSFQAAARAVEQIGNLTQWQKLEIDVLDSCVAAIESSRLARKEGPPELAEGRTGDRILERSVQSSLSASSASQAVTPPIWGLIARLNIAQGFPDAAKEALRKQLRALAGVGWQQDVSHLQAYARAIIASAKLLMSMHESDDKAVRRELSSSRMLLQTFLKSVPEEYRQEPILLEIQTTLDAVQKAVS